MNFHKDFPWGKGLWIWSLKECLPNSPQQGQLPAIIQKLKENNISYVLIKSGEDERTFAQYTPQVVQAFHDAGIKVYSWTYNRGSNPIREAAVAIWSLEQGSDGHVFDAEGEYEQLGNNAQAAETMLKAVRERFPDKFLAYSPFPIIDYHTRFPYVAFGKYCDAVIPQVYFGTMKQTPHKAVSWMYDNWDRWQKTWTEQGHADAVKPIIPAGQAYDNPNISPSYTLTPTDLRDFIAAVKGYRSVTFWSMQHLLRPDCWEAIRDNNVDAPIPSPAPQTEELTTMVTGDVVGPVDDTVVADVVIPVPVPEIPAAPAGSADAPEVPIITPDTTPVKTELPAKIDVPLDKGTTTITVKPNDAFPDGMEVKVVHATRHIDYFKMFILRLLSLLGFKKL